MLSPRGSVAGCWGSGYDLVAGPGEGDALVAALEPRVRGCRGPVLAEVTVTVAPASSADQERVVAPR